MTKIFISYSRVDEKNFVEPFVAVLREHYGYENIWYDRHLIGGQAWWSSILTQLSNADVFLWLLSNDSIDSEYCLAEYEESQRLGKPVVTVQIRDRTRIPREVSAIQYVDMSGGNTDITDSLKIISLIKAIDSQAQQPTPRRPKWQPATPCPALPDPTEEIQIKHSQPSKNLPIINAPRQPVSARSNKFIPVIALLGILVVLFAVGLFMLPDLLGEESGKKNITSQTPTEFVVEVIATNPPTDVVTESTTTDCRDENTAETSATPFPIPTVDVEDTAFTFARIPVDLSKMRAFQYYGNTVFAYKYGRNLGYTQLS